MKVQSKLRLVVWPLFALLCIGAIYWLSGAERREMERINPWLKIAREREEQCEQSHAQEWKRLTNRGALTNLARGKNYTLITRKDQMTTEERAALAVDFKEKFVPAVTKWFAAYPGRIPFEPQEFTLESFHSRVYGTTYTFMIGDTTLCINSNDRGTSVGYLMTRKEAVQMNSVPGKGFVPDISTPVTREQAVEYALWDTGHVFKPNEVLIKPSATSCALNGGAFIDFLITGDDPENALNYKLSLVFRSDGKLVSYLRKSNF